jgi:hypothetical protein
LNRYAEPLREDYREQADPELCGAIAASFLDHIREYILERDAPVIAVQVGNDPTKLELKHENGDSVDIHVFGNEAFELWDYSMEPFLRDDHVRIGTTWTDLDRSGLVFLTHMFVDSGRIVVPDTTDSEGSGE